MEGYGIAAFRSRQQVLRFEAALARYGISSRVVSTPREIAVGCGLSLQFSLNDLQAVEGALARERPSNLIGLYRLAPGGDGRPALTALSRRG